MLSGDSLLTMISNLSPGAMSILLVALSIILYPLAQVIYNIYLHPLSKYPGPRLWAASRIPREIATVTGRIQYTVKALHDKYGDVVRIGPNEVVFTSAEAIRDVYSRHGSYKGPFPKDPGTYNARPGGVRDIITVINEADHSRYRKSLSHAFSKKALDQEEPLIRKYVDLLMKRLHEHAGQGAQDMTKWFNFVAFDVISDLAIGETFGCLKKNEMHPWVEFLYKSIQLASWRTSARRFKALSTALLWFVPKKLIKERKEQLSFTKRTALKRIQMGPDRPGAHDFMTDILRHTKENNVSTEELLPSIDALLIAGSETTATTLVTVIYLLLRHPEKLAKLVDEIRCTFNSEDEINQASVERLVYTRAVIDEAMRYFPPTPLGPPRVVPGKGQFVADNWIPGGTTVWIPTYATNRQPLNWVDADLFVPERFLGDPRYNADNKDAYMPFSVGPRNCIGMSLAYIEMRLVLARLVWNFDLELDGRSKNWTRNMKQYVLWQKPPMYVKLKPV